MRVLTLRSAATLLASSDSLHSLRAIAAAMGFTAPPLSLDGAARLALDLHMLDVAELMSGVGSCRHLNGTLAALADDGLDPRGPVRALAHALLTHAPLRHWSFSLIDQHRRLIVIGVVTSSTHGPRISALRVDRTRVVDSDADTLRALASVTDTDDALRHARFADILQRDALSARFYRHLERTVGTLATTAIGTADRSARQEIALLYASRCLFVAFLQAKGWLDDDPHFLLHHATGCLERGGDLHRRLLKPLFFGTLNTPKRSRAPAARGFGTVPFLNGGLFAATPVERAHPRLRFTDDAIVALIGELLDRYRFTAREDSATWSEAAVDPEMLGRAFESLMDQSARKSSGSYYTPPALVESVIDDALHSALPELAHDERFEPAWNASRSSPTLRISPVAGAALRARIAALRILDPACGSGAFLVQMLERLSHLLTVCGDTRPLHTIRRTVLSASIFGVDRNPMAVWLCELRLWLSIVIESPDGSVAAIPPLPNLDHNIHVGDSLAGGDFRFGPLAAIIARDSPNTGESFPAASLANRRRDSLSALRERYTASTGARKRNLARTLDHAERTRAIAALETQRTSLTLQRGELLRRLRARDLFGERHRPSATDLEMLRNVRAAIRTLDAERRRVAHGGALPFRFVAHFADVAAQGGFDIVVGNPPWVRPHAIAQADRERLRATFESVRTPAWSDGAKRAGAGLGFSAQADLSTAFIEQSVRLLATNGTVALLVPAKLWRALAGGGIRHLLTTRTRIRTLRDWSDAPALFDAAVYPSLIVASRARNDALALASAPHTHAFACTQPTPPPHAHPRTHSHLQTHPEPPSPPWPSPSPSPSLQEYLHPDHVAEVSVYQRRVNHTFTIRRASLPLGGDSRAPWVLLPPDVRDAFERLRSSGPPLGDSSLGRPLLGVKCGLNSAFIVHHPPRPSASRDNGNDGDDGDDGDARFTDIVSTDGRRSGSIERELLRPVLKGEHLWGASPTECAAVTTSIVWTHDMHGSPLRSLPPRAARWLGGWRRELERRSDARGRGRWWSLFRTEAARAERPRVVWADFGRALRARVLASGDPTVPINTCYVLPTASETDAHALAAILLSPLAQAWFDTLAEPARGGYRRYLGWTVSTLPIPRDWDRHRTRLAHAYTAIHRTAAAVHPQRSAPDDAPDALLQPALDAYGIARADVMPLIDWYRK